MSRRTTAIAAALSVLALGSTLISSCANPLAINSCNSGVDKYEQGDYQGAIADSNKAIVINPQFAPAYSNRGNAKIGLKDSHGACADFKKAVSLDHKATIQYLSSENGSWCRNMR